MRDHREGMDPSPRDITEQLREALRNTGRPIRPVAPRAKKQTNVRKARRRQAEQSRRKNR